MKEAVVYMVRCRPIGMGYVGSTKNLRQRKHQHRSLLRNKKHWCEEMQAAWDEYGSRNFEWLVLERIMDDEPLGEAESRWIAKLRDSLWNSGGDHYVWNKGMKMGPLSETTRNKMSASRMGRKMSPEARKRLSEARKGMTFSDDHRRNLSKSLKGNKCAEGAARSEEYKNARGKPVAVTDPDGNTTTYPRIALAAEQIGYERANMLRVLRSGGLVKRGPFAGWRFEYE